MGHKRFQGYALVEKIMGEIVLGENSIVDLKYLID